MLLTEDDELLASAVRFLFDTRQDEAAQLLLTCALSTDEDEGLSGLRRRLTLKAPAATFIVLQDSRNALTIAVKNALNNVTPRASLLFGKELDIVVGYPDRDPNVQAQLIEFARGADVPPPVVEASSSRTGTPHLLVTPIDIFPVQRVQRDDRLCFIMMPFDPSFQDVYDYGIKPAIEDVNLTWQRADDIHEPGSILRQIWASLLKARFVIADLSRTNGNVLYELGLAHVLGHSAILLAQDINDVPFDLRHQRIVVYPGTSRGIEEQLRPELRSHLQSLLKQDR